jgi:hypothetical protein
MKRLNRLSAVMALASATALSACSGADALLDPGQPVFADGPVQDPLLRQFVVCKIGSSATFEVTVGKLLGRDITWSAPTTHTLIDGECKTVHTFTATDGSSDSVIVTELAQAGIRLDSIVRDSIRQSERVRLPTIVGSNTTAGTVLPARGFIATFHNSVLPPPPPPPPPGGGEGCTPGFWKQWHHFGSWEGYHPLQKFSTVFEDAFPGKTLLQVLAQGGGGLNALGRHTVAALLNAANDDVSFGLTVQQVIDAFNAEFPGGDYEALKDAFADLNEQGCPLGRTDHDDDDDDDDHDRDRCNRDNKWHKKWGSWGRGHDRDRDRDHDKDRDGGDRDRDKDKDKDRDRDNDRGRDHDRDRGRGW